ncbi:MAG: ABC transporter permease [Phycisphaerales bacterium]|nr:ABC transporter permease [Phycisphaerales bacterium]
MNAQKTLLVAQREYKSTVMTKAFIFGAIVFPIIIWTAAILIPALVRTETPQLAGTVAIMDGTGVVSDSFKHALNPDTIEAQVQLASGENLDERAQKALEQLGAQNNPVAVAAAKRQIERFLKQPVPALQYIDLRPEEENEEQLRQDVLSGKLIAWIHIDERALDPLAQDTVSMLTSSSMHSDNSERLSSVLAQSIINERFAQMGMDVQSVVVNLIPPRVATMKAKSEGNVKSSEIADIFVPMGFMMLLWISTFTGGQYLLTSTVEEKTNKIIEVVLSGTSPMQLMTGKILGQGAVALTMLLLYAGMAIVGLQRTGYGYLVDWSAVAVIFPYFIMAFFFIACMMAAIGSAVNEMREAQALMGPVMMIVMLPLLAWMPIVRGPNDTFATIASFIPPMTPFVMALRLGTNQPIPVWQTVATMIIGFAAVFVFIWMTAKIFRIGILMHGKAPNFMTLLRWVRMA